MAKLRKVFICSSCGAQSPKWIGKCPSCQEWNTYHEEILEKPGRSGGTAIPAWKSGEARTTAKPILLQEVQAGNTLRLPTFDNEFNRVLGGGIVSGSIILIGGQPGIGKSTLLLQVALQLKQPVLYVSGEESEEQIKLRAERVGLQDAHCYILTETQVDQILLRCKELAPALLIIDSIQTLRAAHIESTPGSVSQVRESAGELQRFAKETGIPVILIGHINKEGAIAGPKLLEHIVDVVLQFEGDRHYSYRILRTIKNRFGSTDELGIYEMQQVGLRQVSNPSELLLSQNEESLSGSAIAATVEGQRPVLIETQALVTKAVYGTPQRSATGFDLRRLNMLLAVLEKRGGFPLGVQDVFLNMAGGIRVTDPAIDLAIVSALLSSFEDIAIPDNYCFAAEVGLSGEVRAISFVEQRIQEAERLGFKQIFISKYNLKGLDTSSYDIKVQAISKVEELYQLLFGI